MRRVAAAAGLLTVLLFVLAGGTATRAWAQTAPTPTTAPTTATTLPPCPTNTATTLATLCDGGGSSYGPGDTCLVGGDPNSTTGIPGCDGTSNPAGGLQNNLLGSCNHSPVPDDHYDVMYSTGGGLFAKINAGRQVPGILTNFAFTAVRWTVHAAQCIIDWALQFHLADGFSGVASTLSNAYQTRIIGPLNLSGLTLFLCVVWCAYHILRGRHGKGWGEMAFSFILAAMFAGVASQPAAFLLGPNGMMGRARATAVELAGITASVDPASTPPPQPGDGPLQQNSLLMGGFHRAFVETPWQLLNWGEQLDNTAAPAPQSCIDAMHQIAVKGPWGTSDTPRSMMSSAGCKDLAKYNYDPSADRLAGSVMTFWGAEWVVVFAVILAFILALAQFALVGCVITFPFVAPMALLPGGGRQWLWKWITSALVAFATVLASVMALSLLLVSVDAIVHIYQGQALIIVIGALDLLVVSIILVLFRLRRSMRRSAKRLGESLNNLSVGGAGGNRWLAPSSSGAQRAIGVAEAYTLYRGYRQLRSLTNAVSSRGRTNQGGAPRPELSPEERLRKAHKDRIRDSRRRGNRPPDADQAWADNVRPGDMETLRDLHGRRRRQSGQDVEDLQAWLDHREPTEADIVRDAHMERRLARYDRPNPFDPDSDPDPEQVWFDGAAPGDVDHLRDLHNRRRRPSGARSPGDGDGDSGPDRDDGADAAPIPRRRGRTPVPVPSGGPGRGGRGGRERRPTTPRPRRAPAPPVDDQYDDEDLEWLERAAAEADERNRRHVGQVRMGGRWVIGRSVPMDEPAVAAVPDARPDRDPEPRQQRSVPGDMDTLRRLHAERQRRQNGDKP